ncbi:MAG TPA: DUF881 domain-containing protein [Marmoricola sp.]|nr:DUF881 domain-containing protein [Marmoricola sp.]
MSNPADRTGLRDRLSRGLRLDGWRLVTLAVFVVAGALFITSAITSGGLDLRASSVTDLDTVVRQERARTDALQERVAALNDEVSRLGESVDDAGVTELQAQVEALRGPAGFEAVHGPAVTVVLEDAPEQDIAAAVESGQITRDDLVVHQQDIQAVVNALWLGGAEAMTLQDQRVISTTGIKCVGNTVVLHGVPYAPPYEITAIGDVSALLQALEESEYIAGYRTYVEAYDLGYEVTVQDDVEMPAYQGSNELRYADEVTSRGTGEADDLSDR